MRMSGTHAESASNASQKSSALAVPVLAAVQGDHDRARPGGPHRDAGTLEEVPQRVDARIADLEHALRRHPLRDQVAHRGRAGCEVPLGVTRDLPAKPFLGKRIARIVGAKPRFHMRDTQVRSVRRARSGIRRCRVPLHDDHVRTDAPQGGAQVMREVPYRVLQIGGSTVGRQLVVAVDPEAVQDVAHRGRMLAGVHHVHGECRALLQRLDQGCELDRLRSRTDDDRDAA